MFVCFCTTTHTARPKLQWDRWEKRVVCLAVGPVGEAFGVSCSGTGGRSFWCVLQWDRWEKLIIIFLDVILHSETNRCLPFEFCRLTQGIVKLQSLDLTPTFLVVLNACCYRPVTRFNFTLPPARIVCITCTGIFQSDCSRLWKISHNFMAYEISSTCDWQCPYMFIVWQTT